MFLTRNFQQGLWLIGSSAATQSDAGFENLCQLTSKWYKTEYDVKVIMYLAYDPHDDVIKWKHFPRY